MRGNGSIHPILFICILVVFFGIHLSNAQSTWSSAAPASGVLRPGIDTVVITGTFDIAIPNTYACRWSHDATVLLTTAFTALPTSTELVCPLPKVFNYDANTQAIATMTVLQASDTAGTGAFVIPGQQSSYTLASYWTSSDPTTGALVSPGKTIITFTGSFVPVSFYCCLLSNPALSINIQSPFIQGSSQTTITCQLAYDTVSYTPGVNNATITLVQSSTVDGANSLALPTLISDTSFLLDASWASASVSSGSTLDLGSTVVVSGSFYYITAAYYCVFLAQNVPAFTGIRSQLTSPTCAGADNCHSIACTLPTTLWSYPAYDTFSLVVRNDADVPIGGPSGLYYFFRSYWTNAVSSDANIIPSVSTLSVTGSFSPLLYFGCQLSSTTCEAFNSGPYTINSASFYAPLSNNLTVPCTFTVPQSSYTVGCQFTLTVSQSTDMAGSSPLVIRSPITPTFSFRASWFSVSPAAGTMLYPGDAVRGQVTAQGSFDVTKHYICNLQDLMSNATVLSSPAVLAQSATNFTCVFPSTFTYVAATYSFSITEQETALVLPTALTALHTFSLAAYWTTASVPSGSMLSPGSPSASLAITGSFYAAPALYSCALLDTTSNAVVLQSLPFVPSASATSVACRFSATTGVYAAGSTLALSLFQASNDTGSDQQMIAAGSPTNPYTFTMGASWSSSSIASLSLISPGLDTLIITGAFLPTHFYACVFKNDSGLSFQFNSTFVASAAPFSSIQCVVPYDLTYTAGSIAQLQIIESTDPMGYSGSLTIPAPDAMVQYVFAATWQSASPVAQSKITPTVSQITINGHFEPNMYYSIQFTSSPLLNIQANCAYTLPAPPVAPFGNSSISCVLPDIPIYTSGNVVTLSISESGSEDGTLSPRNIVGTPTPVTFQLADTTPPTPPIPCLSTYSLNPTTGRLSFSWIAFPDAHGLLQNSIISVGFGGSLTNLLAPLTLSSFSRTYSMTVNMTAMGLTSLIGQSIDVSINQTNVDQLSGQCSQTLQGGRTSSNFSPTVSTTVTTMFGNPPVSDHTLTITMPPVPQPADNVTGVSYRALLAEDLLLPYATSGVMNPTTGISPIGIDFTGYSFVVDPVDGDGNIQSAFAFPAPVTLTLGYGSSQDSSREKSLRLYYFDTATNTWKDPALTCSPSTGQVVDTGRHQVSVQVCHFCQYGLFIDKKTEKPSDTALIAAICVGVVVLVFFVTALFIRKRRLSRKEANRDERQRLVRA